MAVLRQLSGLILYPQKLWGRGSIDLLFLGAEEHLILYPQKFGERNWWIALYLSALKQFLYFFERKLPSLDLRAGWPRRAGKNTSLALSSGAVIPL